MVVKEPEIWMKILEVAIEEPEMWMKILEGVIEEPDMEDDFEGGHKGTRHGRRFWKWE